MSSPAEDDPLVQMNVRVPQSVKDAATARAADRDLSLGKWVANACRFALQQHGILTTASGRTATPPHQRRREDPNL
jgi:hypothetical protein